MDTRDNEDIAAARYAAVMEHLSSFDHTPTNSPANELPAKLILKQARIHQKREVRRARMIKWFGRENAQKIRETHRKLKQSLKF